MSSIRSIFVRVVASCENLGVMGFRLVICSGSRYVFWVLDTGWKGRPGYWCRMICKVRRCGACVASTKWNEIGQEGIWRGDIQR